MGTAARSHGPDEGDEGDEGRQADDQGLGHPRECGDQGGEEDGEVHDPGLVHDQDAPEAREQGGQEGDLRKAGDGQGEASQDHREGLRGGGAEEIDLSSSTYFCPGPGVCESPVGAPREACQVVQCWLSCGGVGAARLYNGGGSWSRGGVTKE